MTAKSADKRCANYVLLIEKPVNPWHSSSGNTRMGPEKPSTGLHSELWHSLPGMLQRRCLSPSQDPSDTFTPQESEPALIGHNWIHSTNFYLWTPTLGPPGMSPPLPSPPWTISKLLAASQLPSHPHPPPPPQPPVQISLIELFLRAFGILFCQKTLHLFRQVFLSFNLRERGLGSGDFAPGRLLTVRLSLYSFNLATRFAYREVLKEGQASSTLYKQIHATFRSGQRVPTCPTFSKLKESTQRLLLE